MRGFNYVLKNAGVVTEEAYPSHLEDQTLGNCSYGRADLAGRISGYVNVSANDTLLEFALTQNPVATAVDAHHRDFLFYDSGVFTSDECTDQVTHGVLLVGYGETYEGEPYWTIKNSWNEQWGDGGTFKIARGTNECGIEDDVSGINF